MQYLKAHPIGEVFDAPFDVVLSEFDIVVPDLVYVSHERAHLLTAKNLQGPPDLVVEILSPATRNRDRRLKRQLYERVCVREFWIVDPDEDTVTVYRQVKEGSFELAGEHRAAAGDTLCTPLFPGLTIRLGQLLSRG
jgi:Uma2 family endonuclease